MHNQRFFRFLAAAVLGLGSQAMAEPPAESSSARPLRILLTSDDGINGSGLRTLRDVLCGAGHRVTVVAPTVDRSGSSAALTLNVNMRGIRSEFPCGDAPGTAFAVTGTPSDAVLFGLSVAFTEDAPPDLVVSGINLGQNVGRAVNHSGTVGAAVTAAEEGVPSIAISVGLNLADASTGFSQTVAAAPHAATFVKDLAELLRDTARDGERLLPDRVALNVNYPVVLDEAGRFDPALLGAPRVTFVGHAHVVRPQYIRVPNTLDTYQALGPICGLQTACAPETQPDADTTALEEGAVSVTPLSVDGTERPELRPRLRVRLRR